MMNQNPWQGQYGSRTGYNNSDSAFNGNSSPSSGSVSASGQSNDPTGDAIVNWALPAAGTLLGGPIGGIVGGGLALGGSLARNAINNQNKNLGGASGTPGYNGNNGGASTGSTNGGGTVGINPNAGQIPGYDMWQNQMQQGAAAAPLRGPVIGQAANIDTGPQGQWRQNQMALYNQLSNQAAGMGPSLAQMQLNRGAQQNMAQAMALQASQRGMGSAGAMRQIANQRAQIGQQMTGDSAMARLQEQLQAQQQMAALGTNARGQDIGLAGNQAQLQQQMSLANMDSAQKQRAMNDQMVQFYLGRGMDMSQAQAQANVQMQNIMSQNQLGNDANDIKRQQMWAGAIGGALGGGVGSGLFGQVGKWLGIGGEDTGSAGGFDGSVSAPVDMSGGSGVSAPVDMSMYTGG